MLRFDPSGVLHPESSVSADQIKSLWPQLLELRQELVGAEASWGAFYPLPQTQLEAYTRHRESSELGRIFKVANSQMGLIDAVVFIGAGSSYTGPRALLNACCDPFHNELTRGPRGGKPRFYFCGNDFDNDTLQALLSRVAAGGYGDTDEELKWAIVVIDADGNSSESEVALRAFSSLLRKVLEGDDVSLLRRLVVPITGANSKLAELASQLGCKEVFAVPEFTRYGFEILSPVGLVPAAMIGLDIMKLLEGAVFLNQQFATAPPDKNMVFQYIAVNHWLAMQHGVTARRVNVWDKSLIMLAEWYMQLGTETICPRYLQSSHGYSDRGCLNLIVEQCRTDPLLISTGDYEQAVPCKDTISDLPDMMVANRLRTIAGMRSAGRPTIDIVLPVIDTFVLGQLLQMLMIATAIENRMNAVTPVE